MVAYDHRADPPLLGSGVSWLAVLIAAALGNAANTLLLDSVHRSIGASTAVFATLGVLASYVWRARLMAQDRWPTRFGPIVGGIALLMFTGTGDQNTDVGAHLMGFVCGFATGMFLTLLGRMPQPLRVQYVAGSIALSVVAVAWTAALLG